MKNFRIFLHFISAFTVTGTIILFFFLAAYHNSPIWKGYRVLAVPAVFDIKDVMAAAENAGITTVVSEQVLANRFAFLKELRYSGFPFTNPDHYRQWFYNPQKTIQYYYIPYTSAFMLFRLYAYLFRNIGSFYLEPPFAYSGFAFCITLVLFLYCLRNTANKRLFSAASTGFLLYALCSRNPLSVSIALLSLYTAAYWVAALDNIYSISWKHLKERIEKNIGMLFLPLFLLGLAIFSGREGFCFFLLAIILTTALVFSVYSFLHACRKNKDKSRLHPSFTVFPMHPNSWHQFWDTRYAVHTGILTVVLLCVAAVFPLSIPWNRLQNFPRTLEIPSPVATIPYNFTDDGFFAAVAERAIPPLPDASSYIEDCWYALTLPYMNVHNPLTPVIQNTKIVFDFFSKDRNGVITKETKAIHTFNTAFIQHILRQESFALFPLEKMLIEQGGFSAASYQSQQLQLLGKWYVFIFSISALCFPVILIIMARKNDTVYSI